MKNLLIVSILNLDSIIIKPDSLFKYIWDFLFLIFLIILLILIPYKISFYENEVDKSFIFFENVVVLILALEIIL